MSKEIQKLRNKFLFSPENLAEVCGIKIESAKMLCTICTRYTKKGIFLRIKKNFYILEQNWAIYSK